MVCQPGVVTHVELISADLSCAACGSVALELGRDASNAWADSHHLPRVDLARMRVTPCGQPSHVQVWRRR